MQRICIGALLFFFAMALSAQQAAEPQPAAPAPVNEALLPIGDSTAAGGSEAATRAIGFGDVLRMLFVLVTVVAVIYITFALLKRASRSRVASSTIIHNISTVPLGGNRALHVIRVGERYYLIGSAEQNVQLIEALDDPATVEFINANRDDRVPSGEASFKSRIRTLLGAIHKPAAPGGGAGGGVPSAMLDRISHHHRRLKDI